MADTDASEWKLFDTDLVTVLGILPASESHLYLVLNEPGSGELKIPLESNLASGMASGMFAQCSYRGEIRGGFFVENMSEGQADSSENSGKWLSISGRGALSLLDDAIVWSSGSTESTRDFAGVSKAEILITLITEAQARGALVNVSYDFTETLDSRGEGWTDNDTPPLTVGKSLLDVVRDFAKAGIDFDITPNAGNFVLSAYKSAKGSDKSGTVYLRVGLSCTELTADERVDKIKNALLVAYKGGYITVKDDDSILARRRRERLLEIKSAQTSSSATTIGAAEVALYKDPKRGIVVKVNDGAGPRGFVDYELGDYIKLDNAGVENRYRIYGMQPNWVNGKYADVVLELNSIFNDNDIEMAQDIDWLIEQINTANDAGLLEVSYWSAIGDPNLTYGAGDLHLIGNTLFVVSGTYIFYCNMITRQWTSVDIGRSISCLESIGTDLYIGCFHEIFKWDTTSSTLTSIGLVYDSSNPMAEQIIAMCAMGTDLYVSGVFDDIDGNAINQMAKYDSLTDTWTAWGTGSGGSGVLDLLTVGSNIYAGGYFTSINGVPANRVAMWNGTNWAALSTGLDGAVSTLAAYGTNILAGGSFTGYLAEWDGVAWATFGGGSVTGAINDIAVFLTDVYVVGNFTDIGNYIAKYSGGFWWNLLGGLNANTNRVLMYGDDVIVSGAFTEADGKPAQKIAEYFTSFESLLDYLSTSSTFDMGAAIHNAPAAALTNASEIPFWDAVTGKLRKITWSNIKATLKTYFDTLYVALTGNQTVAGIKTFTSFPVTPSSAPSADYEVANKKYVDDNSGLPALDASRVVITDGTGTISTNANLLYNSTTNHETHGLTANNWGGNNAIIQSNTGASTQHIIEVYGTSSTTAPQVVGVRGGGTYSVPTGISSGEMLLRLRGWAFDSSGALESNSSGDIRIIASEAHSPTARGTRLEFYTTPATTTTLTKSLVIGEGGIASNVTAAKTLTLTATDNYTLTVPATGTAALLERAQTFTLQQTITVPAQIATSTALTVTHNLGNAPANNQGVGLSVQSNTTAASNADNWVFGAKYTVTHAGQQSITYLISHQNILNFLRAGKTADTVIGVSSQVDSNLGTLSKYFGVKVGAISNTTTSIVTGTVTSAYGLYVNPVTGAGTSNYSIYTNAATSGARFGHQLTIDGSTDVNQLKVTGYTAQTNPVGYLIDNTATTNAIRNVLQLEAQSTGTAAAGFGAGLLYSMETATSGTMQTAAQVYAKWEDAANATRKGALYLSAYDTAERIGLEIEASGSAVKLGFFGGTTQLKQTGDIIAALNTAGLITSPIIAHGSMYKDDVATAVTVSVADSYYQVGATWTTGTNSAAFTFQNSRELLCNTAGTYLASWSMTVSHSNSDRNSEGAVMVNSTVASNTVNATRTKESGVDYSVGGTGIITLAVNDVVKLCVSDETGTGTITVNHGNLTLIRIA